MSDLAAVTTVGAAGAVSQHTGHRKPRVGFLGLGWIGRHRMEAMNASGCIEVAAIADPAIETQEQAAVIAPEATLMGGLDDLLSADLDGIVIATPSAMHAEQSIAALERGIAVFCQKPLARNADETRRVVDEARAADRLLSVDLSYRYVAGMDHVRDMIRNGELGDIFAANLVFHNAYGPDKAWFYNPQLSGGGCVIDLGIHLVDLALWMLDFPAVVSVQSNLYAGGKSLNGRADIVEDYAVAVMELSNGTNVQLACSWRLQAGREAIIEASFYGTQGGAALRNVKGSFYDFTVERYRGTSSEVLSSPPDEWGGRAAVDWARRLAAGELYDPSLERIVDVAATLDRIYGR
ncbi:MAG TPA: Gfo/Idh/MocA family oxidoreductase [Chloroflexia bacterium]|jgi:predicted dehydrogenase